MTMRLWTLHSLHVDSAYIWRRGLRSAQRKTVSLYELNSQDHHEKRSAAESQGHPADMRVKQIHARSGRVRLAGSVLDIEKNLALSRLSPVPAPHFLSQQVSLYAENKHHVTSSCTQDAISANLAHYSTFS